MEFITEKMASVQDGLIGWIQNISLSCLPCDEPCEWRGGNEKIPNCSSLLVKDIKYTEVINANSIMARRIVTYTEIG